MLLYYYISSNLIFHDIKDYYKNDLVSGVTMTLDKGGYVILIKDIKNKSFFPHEIYHACDRILKDREIEHTELDEAYAYLLGWIFEQYFNLFNIELTIKTEEKCE